MILVVDDTGEQDSDLVNLLEDRKHTVRVFNRASAAVYVLKGMLSTHVPFACDLVVISIYAWSEPIRRYTEIIQEVRAVFRAANQQVPPMLLLPQRPLTDEIKKEAAVLGVAAVERKLTDQIDLKMKIIEDAPKGFIPPEFFSEHS